MEIIAISQTQINGADVNSVNARDLWENLEIGKDFSNWVKTQIGSLGLVENIDYIFFAQKGENPNQQNGRPKIEYIVTLDIAKHIALASRTSKGREIRNYFIEVEKQAIANKPQLPQDLPTALRAYADEVEKNKLLANENAQLQLTKAEIGTRREATAMATASKAVRKANRLEDENNSLQIQLNKKTEYCTVTAVENKIKGKYDWRLLKNVSKELGCDRPKVHDDRWGTARSYHKKVWLKAYGIDIEKIIKDGLNEK